MGTMSPFAFSISLAAVINGLGIVGLLSTFAAVIDRVDKTDDVQYWVYQLLVAMQFLFHILLFWSMWDIMLALENFNFLTYLYFLLGPILLYLSTQLLLPKLNNEQPLDLRNRYYYVAPRYFTVMSLLWLWSISFWPFLVGVWAPDTPLTISALVICLILRFSKRAWVHETLLLAYFGVFVLAVVIYSLELGGIGNLIREALDG
ncbi:MAG: hypothetical protein ACR2QB_11275 [Gammaproteobacteria bacterium]